MTDTDDTTLARQTEDTLNAFMGSLPGEVQAIVGGSFEKLMASDAGAKAQGVGDMAPDFTLPGVKGGDVSLSALLESGPVVLSFYRGGWCPFCNLEFRALQTALPEIQALGATLIGVSPETPDTSLSTAEKHGLEFNVLSDVGNQVARRYGLIMLLYEEMRPLYREWGMDVPAANGDESYELPLPATYVIGRTGVIHAAYVNKNYTQRMEPAAIIQALRDINE